MTDEQQLERIERQKLKAIEEANKYRNTIPPDIRGIIKDFAKKIELLQAKIAKFENLFFNDFLYFFNSQLTNYESFELLFYLYPETYDINCYLKGILNDILKTYSNINSKTTNDYELRNNLIQQIIPTIDQIVDKINTQIANDKIGKSSGKLLKPINKDQILKLLYLYTKDLKYKNYKIKDLIREILSFNDINFENPCTWGTDYCLSPIKTKYL